MVDNSAGALNGAQANNVVLPHGAGQVSAYDDFDENTHHVLYQYGADHGVGIGRRHGGEGTYDKKYPRSGGEGVNGCYSLNS